MDVWDRFGLIIILVISLVTMALVLSNASISGFSIANLLEKSASGNDQQRSMTIFTIMLLVASVVTILITYLIHSKTD